MFADTVTAINVTSLVQATGQGVRFENVTTGIDAISGGNNIFNLIDSGASGTQIVLATTSGSGVTLENVIVNSTVPAVW